jgi:hypothetical protein
MSNQNKSTIYNLTLTNANTEYSIALPTGTKSFEWQCRTSVDVRYAYVTGKVATPTTPYSTIKSGATYNSHPNMYLGNNANFTIYFASGTAGAVVELTAWQ